MSAAERITELTQHGFGLAQGPTGAQKRLDCYVTARASSSILSGQPARMLLKRPSTMGQTETVAVPRRVGFAVVVMLLVAIDFASRLISLSAGPFAPQFDALTYWQMAGQMAAGDWLMWEPHSAFRTPLYPAYVACWRLIAGPRAFQSAILGQHLMGVVTSLLTGWMCPPDPKPMDVRGRLWAFSLLSGQATAGQFPALGTPFHVGGYRPPRGSWCCGVNGRGGG